MFPSDLKKITRQHIDALYENEVHESTRIEYKRILPSLRLEGHKRSDDELSIKFVASVASLANTSGGDIVFGIDAPDGIPVSIDGVRLDKEELETTKLLLQQLADAFITPRVSLEIEACGEYEKGPVIVVRVPRSWKGPHWIARKEWFRIYGRHATGKYVMNIDQIRDAFAFSHAIIDRLRNWRGQRLNKILSDELLRMPNGTIFVLHVLPFQSFAHLLDISMAQLESQMNRVQPICRGSDFRRNIDGLLTFYQLSAEPADGDAYCQTYRSGQIESVTSYPCFTSNGDVEINAEILEQGVLTALGDYLAALQEFGVTPPIIVQLCALRAKRATFQRNLTRIRVPERGHPIDRDSLIGPEVLIEDYECDLAKVVRPMFDSVWHAAGLRGSPFYKGDGTRAEHAPEKF